MIGRCMLVAVMVAVPLGGGLAQDQVIQQMEGLYKWRDDCRQKIHQKLEGAVKRLEGEREKAAHGFMERQHEKMEAAELQKMERLASVDRAMERAMEKLERRCARKRESIERETREVLARLEDEAKAFHRDMEKKFSQEAERIRQQAEKGMQKVAGIFEKKLEAMKKPLRGTAADRRQPSRAVPARAVRLQPDPPPPEPTRKRVMNARLKARLEQLEEERAKILEHLEGGKQQTDRDKPGR